MSALTRFIPDMPGEDAAIRSSDVTDLVLALSDDDLAALEDELDFHVFTGVPSQRMLRLMDRAGVLDDEWRALLDEDSRTVVPTVILFRPMATHRRAQSRRLPLQVLPELSEIA